MATRREVEIVALHVSAAHAYEGRPSDGPRPDPGPVSRDHVEIRAGLGIAGDRYFNHPAHRNAAVTLIAAESRLPVARSADGAASCPQIAERWARWPESR